MGLSLDLSGAVLISFRLVRCCRKGFSLVRCWLSLVIRLLGAMVCYDVPDLYERIVYPFPEEVEPVEDVTYGGIFTYDDAPPPTLRPRDEFDWPYVGGWFYPMLVSEMPPDGRLSIAQAMWFFRRAGARPFLNAARNLVLWCRELAASRYVFF